MLYRTSFRKSRSRNNSSCITLKPRAVGMRLVQARLTSLLADSHQSVFCVGSMQQLVSRRK